MSQSSSTKSKSIVIHNIDRIIGMYVNGHLIKNAERRKSPTTDGYGYVFTFHLPHIRRARKPDGIFEVWLRPYAIGGFELFVMGYANATRKVITKHELSRPHFLANQIRDVLIVLEKYANK